MKTRIGINGFGRIGRSVFRVLNSRDDIEIVAINDIFDKEALTYLLKYDTVMGRFPSEVSLDGDMLKAGQQNVKLIAERVPSELPWGELDVDIVVESTGIFRQREQLKQHLNAGCKKVVLTVPAKDAIDYTVVLGVNDSGLKSEHKIVSNASCTTNCLAPMAKVLNENFGIQLGVINTILYMHTQTIKGLQMYHTLIGEEVELPPKMLYPLRLVLLGQLVLFFLSLMGSWMELLCVYQYLMVQLLILMFNSTQTLL